MRTAQRSVPLAPARLLAALRQRGCSPFVSVPCSYLGGLLDLLEERAAADHLPVTNEGEAVAVAAGAALAGHRPVVLLQNSGLGNAVNPLSSLSTVFRLPALLLVSWRGDPQGAADEPQHRLMGCITADLLDLVDVRNEPLPERVEDVDAALDRAVAHMSATALPYALLVRRGQIAPRADGAVVAGAAAVAADGATRLAGDRLAARATRTAVIAQVLSACHEGTVLVATTGRTGRELEALADRATNLYMVGSMGCASSIALGIARCRPERPVVVLDGDGAALMRMEAFASIGHYAPRRLVHVLLDNGCHDSTGGQRTLASTVDFPGLARACGYARASSVAAAEVAPALAAAMRTAGPALLRVAVAPGSPPDLGRPRRLPHEVARRLREALANDG